MDLGRDTRSDRTLLSDLSQGVQLRESSLVGEWVGIVAWADRNIVTTPEQAATIVEGVIDTGVPIAGDGAPLVSEFNLMELIAVLGRTPDSGRGYVGRVIECAWRLPGVFASVVEGHLAPWRAERIADLTRPLNAEAAAFVDRQLAAVGGVGWAQLERLVTEAVMRFDPERAEAERLAAADARRFDFDEVDANGLVESHSLLDAADAHDLDLALSRRAKVRGQLGDTDSLDVRRSKAAGDLARQDLSLDLLFADEEGDGQVGRAAAEEQGHEVGRVAPRNEAAYRDPSAPAAKSSSTSTSPTPPSPATTPSGVGTKAAPRSAPPRSRNGSRSPAPASPSAPSSTSPTTSRSTPTRSPTGSGNASSCATTPAGSPGAPDQQSSAISTMSSNTTRVGRPAPATWPQAAGDITAPRPSHDGGT